MAQHIYAATQCMELSFMGVGKEKEMCVCVCNFVSGVCVRAGFINKWCGGRRADFNLHSIWWRIGFFCDSAIEGARSAKHVKYVSCTAYTVKPRAMVVYAVD